MSAITSLKVPLGVTGGIAAYKSAELVRRLREQGAEVQVVMTRAAAEFVTPLTLATRSRRRVISEMFPQGDRGGTEWTEHISLAVWADVMLVAPATAHTIGRLAHGLEDDFLSTLALAHRAPLAVAPAMDVDMWPWSSSSRRRSSSKASATPRLTSRWWRDAPSRP